MSEPRICQRPGCAKPKWAQPRGGHKPYCGRYCRMWHVAFTAFSEGGAALDRNSESDSATFARILALDLDSTTAPALRELFAAYGRR